MSTGISTEIWNRAAMARGRPAPRAGDTAQSSVLAFHNMVMSGGIGHAFDVLTTDEIIAASDGYRYLGLELIADLIGRAPAVLNEQDDEAIEELNNRYNQLVPQDQTLVARLGSALQDAPEGLRTDQLTSVRPCHEVRVGAECRASRRACSCGSSHEGCEYDWSLHWPNAHSVCASGRGGDGYRRDAGRGA